MISVKCLIIHCMKEQVGKQMVVSLRGLVMWVGVIFTLPILLLYFLQTSGKVCGVSGEGVLPFSPPSSAGQHIIQCVEHVSSYAELTGHAVISYYPVLEINGALAWSI